MRLFGRSAGGLALLVLLTTTAGAAEPAPTPLRHVPAEADLVLEAASPKDIVETLYHLDSFRKVQEIAAVKEFLDSTQYRRFYKLVAYFEKELGAKWPELLDQLSGGGAALAVKFGPNPAPALLVVEAKDEAQAQKFKKLAMDVLEQELARQEAKDKPVKGTYQNVETFSVGEEFHFALAGKTILLTNKKEMLTGALDLHADSTKKSLADNASVAEAKKLLPPNPMASLWINMEPVRKSPEFEAVYKTPRDPNLTVVFGGYIDVLSRTPFVAAGVYKEKDGYLTTVRMPRGRDGMGDDLVLHLPKEGEPGSRPLLEPKNVLYSDSFYLDLSRIWLDREKLFGAEIAKALEEADKNSGKVISGLQLSKQLQQAGTYHRFVAVSQPKTAYKKQSATPIPAFAFVTELREPEEFGKTMETVLRGAALLASQQIKMKVVEEKHGDIDVVGYRFPEDVAVPQDVNDIRFNFSPCFCRVGNQYVFCSTLELCRELIDILQKEQKDPPKSSAAKSHYKFYSDGLADAAKGFEDQLIVQALLDQGIPADQARSQTKALLGLLKELGTLEIRATFTKNEFHYDIRAKTGK
jgi:hypothetical protein